MAPKKKDITVEKFLEIWNSPYGKEKMPSYSNIFPYYHENCRFQDSIQSFEGLDKFKEMCKRLEKRCKEIRMEIHAVAKNGNVFLVEWTMPMKFGPAPLMSMYGASKIIFDENGLITLHRDYYDLWGDTLDVMPGIGKLYRWFMRTVMG